MRSTKKLGPIFVECPDGDTPLSLIGPHLRADWYRAGEGYCGDYNPNNPEDTELLRFDIYKRHDPMSSNWEEVEDASYCTLVHADASMDSMKKMLRIIYDRYADVLNDDLDASVKKLGEELSWIGF